MTIPESLGLVFGFWDRSELIKNDFVAKRSRDLSMMYLNSCFPGISKIEHTNVDLILQTAAQSNARWCLVQSHGHMILRFDFYRELEKYLNDPARPNFLVLGHILDRKSEFFEIHHQCFLVDLENYRRLGRPAFGTPSSQSRTLDVPHRSPDNFHDDYTPPWLRPAASPEKREYSAVRDGWNMIDASLRAGLEVPNFTGPLRNFKHFLYPEAYTSDFERALKSPEVKPDYELNDGQRRFLSGMRQNWQGCRSSIFIFNTDDLRWVQKYTTGETKLDGLYAVASGFRALKILQVNGFTPQTEVTYFDYSAAALEFRKKLNATFDGRDFIAFLRKHENDYIMGNYQARPRAAESIEIGDAHFAERLPEKPDYARLEQNWINTIDAFGGAQAFTELWNATNRLSHRYIEADLFDTPSKVSNLIQSDERANILVWWSNSFATESTHTFMPLERIDRAYENFEYVLRNRQGTTYADGTTSRNRGVFGQLRK